MGSRALIALGALAGAALLGWVSATLSFVFVHARAPMGGGEVLNWLMGL